MTSLTHLPSELISTVVSYLNDRDVLQTRLVARYIERSSIAHFGHRFFRKKGYLITTSSLDVLAQVSQHEDLRKYAQHVWFNPDCFTFVRPDCAPDAQEAPDPEDPDSILQLLSPGDRKRYEAFQAVKRDHTRLLARCGAELENRLQPIFAALPNLKIVGMRRSEDHAPWGWRKLMEDVGEDPRELGPIPSGPMYSLSEPTRLFLAIVHAAAATPEMKLRRFYTDAIELDNIRANLLTQETLDKACRHIWYLEINLTKAWLNKRAGSDYNTLISPEDYGEGLLRLLKATQGLKEIGLQIYPERRRPGRPTIPLEQSYPHLCFRKLVQNLQLPHLTRVKLEGMTTTASTLCDFLKPSAARLTSIKIRDFRLLSNEEQPKPWRTVFECLNASCTKLDHLLAHHLLHSGGGISFVEDPLPTPVTDPATVSAWTSNRIDEQFFVEYDNITLQVEGREAVAKRLEEVVERHWYQKPMFSYQMDEVGGGWHTDTSDEEW